MHFIFVSVIITWQSISSVRYYLCLVEVSYSYHKESCEKYLTALNWFGLFHYSWILIWIVTLLSSFLEFSILRYLSICKQDWSGAACLCFLFLSSFCVFVVGFGLPTILIHSCKCHFFSCMLTVNYDFIDHCWTF